MTVFATIVQAVQLVSGFVMGDKSAASVVHGVPKPERVGAPRVSEKILKRGSAPVSSTPAGRDWTPNKIGVTGWRRRLTFNSPRGGRQRHKNGLRQPLHLPVVLLGFLKLMLVDRRARTSSGHNRLK